MTVSSDQIVEAIRVLSEAKFSPFEVWLGEDDARDLGIDVDALLAESEDGK